ncbi:UNVERIFIED_CONTAM: hypothetical protein Cloal_4118 [Acetivibrio alkalicellulosi]
MWLFNLFKKSKKGNNQFENLNNKCDSAFKESFSRCRVEFGREMVQIMNMKSAIIEKINSVNGCTPVQEMLAEKMLELMYVYFNTVNAYVSAKRGAGSETEILEGMKDKINRVYNLINDLNKQFYLNTDKVAGVTQCDEVINEAQALCNVIKNHNNKHKL